MKNALAARRGGAYGFLLAALAAVYSGILCGGFDRFIGMKALAKGAAAPFTADPFLLEAVICMTLPTTPRSLYRD